MTQSSRRKEISDSLLNLLPDIVKSLHMLMEIMTPLIGASEHEPSTELIAEIKKLLLKLRTLMDVPSYEVLEDEKDHEISVLHNQSSESVLKGVQKLLDWIVDKDEPNETLEEALDFLFHGGQEMYELAGKLTDDKTD